MRRRSLLSEEGGFSLVEVTVTMLLMLTMMLALYTVFDMSLRVFGFGSGKVEATESARIGLEKMAREIRAAYPYDKVNGNTTLFPSYTSSISNAITFGNDLNGNRKVDTTTEQITYNLSGSTLQRNGQAAVENVRDVTFTFLQTDGVTLASSETDAAIVRIKLEVSLRSGGFGEPITQVLESDVALRNPAR